MIENQDTRAVSAGASDWSNRILLLGAAGILFLTQYPFEFSSHGKPHRGISPLMLGYGAKSGAMDVLLNILLFVPFGFAIGGKLLRRNSLKSALFYSAIAGCVFSYMVELAQLYIPQRDSGWLDVLTNSTGAVAGCLLFAALGTGLFKRLSRAQGFLERWSTPARVALVLIVYLGLWTLASAFLVRETSVRNWNRSSFLAIGNAADSRQSWSGQLLELQIWDHTVSPQGAVWSSSAQVTAGESPVASFDFRTTPPRQENCKLLIPLVARRGQVNAEQFNGASARPVTDLVDIIRRTRQFSIRAVFQPGEGPGANGRIVSLSPSPAHSDLYLGQNNGYLMFWFWSRSSTGRPALLLRIPDLLTAGSSNDILFSYDGSNLRLYANGREMESYRLGPGAALASHFRRLKTVELKGYKDIYYTIVFFPAGGFLGIAFSKRRWRWFELYGLLILAGLPAPLVFERVLISRGGSFSRVDFALSAGIVLLGFLWARADPASDASESSRGELI